MRVLVKSEATMFCITLDAADADEKTDYIFKLSGPSSKLAVLSITMSGMLL